MDKTAARDIIDKNLKKYMDLTATQDWSITVKFERINSDNNTKNGSVYAEVEVKPDYKFAIISFDYERFDDEAQLLKSLRHELFHLWHAGFTLAFDVLSSFIQDDAGRQAMNRLWHHAAESMVRQAENAFDWNDLHAAGEECTHVRLVADVKSDAKTEPLITQEVLDWLNTHVHPTPMGPTAPPIKHSTAEPFKQLPLEPHRVEVKFPEPDDGWVEKLFDRWIAHWKKADKFDPREIPTTQEIHDWVTAPTKLPVLPALAPETMGNPPVFAQTEFRIVLDYLDARPVPADEKRKSKVVFIKAPTQEEAMAQAKIELAGMEPVVAGTINVVSIYPCQ